MTKMATTFNYHLTANQMESAMMDFQIWVSWQAKRGSLQKTLIMSRRFDRKTWKSESDN